MTRVVDESRLTDELEAARTALRSAEAALAAERRRAQRYLDVAGAMILALDEEHRILAVNRKGITVLGHSEFSLVGRDWSETVVPEPERPAIQHHLERLHAGALETQVADMEPRPAKKERQAGR